MSYENEINCGYDIIKISNASYGRHDRETCPYYRRENTNCHSPNSLCKVKALCDGQTTCALKATSTQFGRDPCVGTYKYLKVLYTCLRQGMVIFAEELVICEGNKDETNCGNDIIKIHDASYGRHDRETCPHSKVSNTNCHSPNSLKKVQALCDGQTTCELTATSTHFGGDPCGGTFKYLKVLYTCLRQ
ncbi:hypothetical protein KUTeg_019894, partial [Tegillarca granosa]